MNIVLFFVVALVLVFVLVANAARILVVIPTPSISHQIVFHPIIQELARRGHDVVSITTDPIFPKGKAPANLTEIDLHDMSYKAWSEIYETSSGNKDVLVNQITMLVHVVTKVFEKQMLTEEVQKIIHNKNETFDLLLLEAWVRPTLALSYIYKVPVIQISSFGSVFDNYNNVGGPWHPFLYPTVTHQRLYNLTLWDKLVELYNYFRIQHMYYSHEAIENEIVRNIFGADVPNLNELRTNIDMLFLNNYHIWEGNIPSPQTVVHMGGLHQKPQKELPMYLKSYLDSSVHGVIYISFGTNVKPSLLPQEKIETMIKVLSQLPYNVLWKWDNDKMPVRSKNINMSKWYPQSDLLRHPKIKLFITQGGLQSTDEAITAGVPLIGIPMLGDQWYNAEKYVHHKIGVKLLLEVLTEENFRNAITTLISDKSYRCNIIKLRTLMLDQPQTPLERTIWWIEHVLRHGGARHYRAPAANMSWTEYLEVELMLTLLLGFVILSIMLVVIVYCLSKIALSSFNYSIKVNKKKFV